MTRRFGDGRYLVSKSEGGTAPESQIFSSRSDKSFHVLTSVAVNWQCRACETWKFLSNCSALSVDCTDL
jgi:hypothetical protein